MATHGEAPDASPETPIILKVNIDGVNRKFKISMRDLNAAAFHLKVRDLLQIAANQVLTLERYSDSSGCYVVLDPRNPASYKQLYRAAKAKLKIRLRASTKIVPAPSDASTSTSQTSAAIKPEELPAELAHRPKAPEHQPSEQQERDAVPPVSIAAFQSKLLESRRALDRQRFTATTGPSEKTKTTPASQSTSVTEAPSVAACWHVCCNRCDKQVTTEHYHCSICDGGDYDLCEECVTAGAACNGEGHWMIKRTLKDGRFVNSTTRTISSKAKDTLAPKAMPGAFSTDAKSAPSSQMPERICNSCIRHLPKSMAVTCQECPDYDLCMPCLVENKHGHHPAHTFSTAVANGQNSLCQPGRNVRHYAVCDSCDQTIFGVRHKCLDCPDFDFCSSCYKTKQSSHKHRFVPVYESLPAPEASKVRHAGVYCDGPVCSGQRKQSYIQGVRYKCAMCDDIDFCASCEAHPGNNHNKAHPMIMFKTSSPFATCTTIEDTPHNGGHRYHGAPLSQTIPAAQAYGSNVPSSETLPAYTPRSAPNNASATPPVVPHSAAAAAAPNAELKAEFVEDRVHDGSSITAGVTFTQAWVMKNSGPHAWPAGCSVRHVGGDHMLNIDPKAPSSVAELSAAQESNVTIAPILPGHSWSFSVVMKAPLRVGKHISYWRLKAPDGMPFGHKLWCDIQVVAVPDPQLRVPVHFPPPPPFYNNDGGVLADYQMQMMLLEQQNKRRMEMVRKQHQEMEAERAQMDKKAKDQASLEGNSQSAPVPTEASLLQQRLQQHQYVLQQQRQRQQQQQAMQLQRASMARRQADMMQIQQAQQQLKAHLSSNANQNSAPVAAAAPPQEQPKTFLPKAVPTQEPVPSKPKAEAESAESTESTIVFPKLEKESPEFSTHEDMDKAQPVTEQVASPSVVTAATTETESLEGEITAKDEFESDSDEDDGFLTDEEYDILDASDEEIINGTNA